MSNSSGGLEARDVRVLMVVLRRLVREEPVDPPALSAGLGLAHPELDAALRRLAAAGVIYVSAGPAVLSRCPHINFFCDTSHAEIWLAAHPTLSGDVLPLVHAAARAQARFASIIRLSRGEAVQPAELRGG